MEANRPWLVSDAISIPSAQYPFPKHPENIIPKFDSDNNVLPEDHIKRFMLSLRLMNVEHEDVVCRYFSYTFVGKVSMRFFSLAARSITSWQQFKTSFITQFGDDKTNGIMFLELSQMKINKRE